MKGKIQAVFPGHQHERIRRLATDFLNFISERTTPDRVLYLDVYEETNPRFSFDVNVYRAEITLNDIRPFLARFFSHYSHPEKSVQNICRDHGHRRLGHLSCGMNREGRESMSMYYGTIKLTKVNFTDGTIWHKLLRGKITLNVLN